MLRWLHLNASHAILPIFQRHPEHPGRECAICATRMKDRVSHIKHSIPLEYQADVVTGTNISRFSIVINDAKDPAYEACGKSAHDVFRNEFQCRINRVLDRHQPQSIAPSAENIASELAALQRLLKAGDNVMVYTHDPSNVLDAFASDDRSQHVWIVATTANGHTASLTCRYEWQDDTGLRSVRSPHGSASKTRLGLLCPSSTDAEPGFTELILHLLEASRYRATIHKILQAAGGRAAFRSSHPLNTRTVYFGFG